MRTQEVQKAVARSMAPTGARRGIRPAWTGPWAWAAAAAAAMVMTVAGPAAVTAAASSPTLRLVVEPLHPYAGTRAEIVAQVAPASLGRGGQLAATLVSPSGASQSVSLARVQGGTPGTWEGLAPVPAKGAYVMRLRYTNGATVLTAQKRFQVVTGSPFGSESSFIVVVVVLGGAWFLMRRRRY